jgi:hypothetical protein
MAINTFPKKYALKLAGEVRMEAKIVRTPSQRVLVALQKKDPRIALVGVQKSSA